MPNRSSDPIFCRAEAIRIQKMAKLSPFSRDREIFQAKADAWLKRAEELERKAES